MILKGARIGADCNICAHVLIEGDVVVGDRVTVKSGVQLWDGLRVSHDVFIGPNATVTNDKHPRSKVYPDRFAETVIEDGASIGAGAVMLPRVRIGARAVIGAGAVVTKDVAGRVTADGAQGRQSGSRWETPVPQIRSVTELFNPSASPPRPRGPDRGVHNA